MVCVPLFWFKIPKDFAQAGFNTLMPLALSRFLSFQHEGRLGRDRCWSQKIKLRFGRSQNRGSFFSDRHLAEGTVEIAVSTHHFNVTGLPNHTAKVGKGKLEKLLTPDCAEHRWPQVGLVDIRCKLPWLVRIHGILWGNGVSVCQRLLVSISSNLHDLGLWF